MLPLGRQCTYEQSRMLGELLARCVLRELNDIATITRHVTKRGDKVYLDYLQNRHGQTIVAPFSVRPLPGATVSMPLRWDEVNESLDPKTFTIRNALERMAIGAPDSNPTPATATRNANQTPMVTRRLSDRNMKPHLLHCRRVIGESRDAHMPMGPKLGRSARTLQRPAEGGHYSNAGVLSSG